MYVAVHMIFRFDPPLNRVKELNTARPHPGAGEIPEAQGRTVSDENVNILRYEVPLVQTLLPAGQVEGPAAILGLVRSSCNQFCVSLRLC